MNILILSPIHPDAVQRLGRDHDVISAIGMLESEMRPLLRDREALVFRSGVDVTAELLGAAPNLKLLIRAGSGLDNIDLDYVQENGLSLVRIPEPGARAVAELTFGLMLASARKILWADQMWRRGHWVKHQSAGYLLRGKVLGIVGAGSIGAQVGEMGASWDMEVIACVAHPSDAVADRLRERGIRLTDFDEVVERADFLCVHVPLSASTRHLIDAGVLDRMQPGSFLISMARGGVVDELALRRALLTGDRVIGAALDVHAYEGDGQVSLLADLPNVVLTPHIGSMAVDTQREIGERIVSIVESHGAASLSRDPLQALA